MSKHAARTRSGRWLIVMTIAAFVATSTALVDAQTSFSGAPINGASGIEYRYPVHDDADAPGEFVSVFPGDLVITTQNRGPFLITFSAGCDMRGGSHPSGGIMLVHVTLDGNAVVPGEIEMMRAGPGQSRSGACSYTWMAPDVPPGRHVVQAVLRIFAGFGGGFARVVTSTMTVVHRR
jgi:hypothetical protein